MNLVYKGLSNSELGFYLWLILEIYFLLALELLEITNEEHVSKNIINCGFITGTKHSLTKLDHELRTVLGKNKN